ncbi:hypothetical protein CSAL01_02729 [Colletotrichum salicis]|uniref:Uncharacterized protein n=1 Tax=Colletotrichum salicis TaxID=1209931 RepID=A0A135V0S1_9PEZI|nr:hypothetical protein CSAL01_02729 [Colletotrichum salicis]
MFEGPVPVQSYTSSKSGAERWFQICQKLELVTFSSVHSRPTLNPKPRVVERRYLSQLLNVDLTVRFRGIDRWTGTNEDVLKSDGSPATPLTLLYGFFYPRSGTDGGAIFQRLSWDRPEGWTRLGCQEKTHIGALGSQKLQRKRASCTLSGTPAWELSQSTSPMHPSHLLLPPPPCISHVQPQDTHHRHALKQPGLPTEPSFCSGLSSVPPNSRSSIHITLAFAIRFPGAALHKAVYSYLLISLPNLPHLWYNPRPTLASTSLPTSIRPPAREARAISRNDRY